MWKIETHVVINAWSLLDRPGAIQTRHQVKHVKHFEEWLKDVRIVFGQPKHYYMVGQDLQGFMIRQHKYLHGQEARDLRCIPKVNQHTIKAYQPQSISVVNKCKDYQKTNQYFYYLKSNYTRKFDFSTLSN